MRAASCSCATGSLRSTDTPATGPAAATQTAPSATGATAFPLLALGSGGATCDSAARNRATPERNSGFSAAAWSDGSTVALKRNLPCA